MSACQRTTIAAVHGLKHRAAVSSAGEWVVVLPMPLYPINRISSLRMHVGTICKLSKAHCQPVEGMVQPSSRKIPSI